MSFPSSFKKLEKRLADDTYRKLSLETIEHDFYSNDYLGISCLLTKERNSFSGSTGSRLISGNSVEAENCEQFLADFFESETALVFNSGYDANLGLFSSLGERNDTFIYDEYIHASIRDGIRLGIAKSFSFKHNDLKDLEKKIQLAQGSVFIAVESLYSMDGDLAPLLEINALCKKYKAFLIVDEAHAGGVLGKDGKGLCLDKNIHQDVFARVFTFGKAYGSHGACILGSKQLKSYLVNFARSFIYTTALPVEQYKIIQESVKLSINPELRVKLKSNIDYFVQLNRDSISYSHPDSPIQIIALRDKKVLKQICDSLQTKGFGVKLILSPTVPKGNERIRICLHTNNTLQEIEEITSFLNKNFKI